MHCPFCFHTDTQVKDSRPSEEGMAIKRRRYCSNCGARFSTSERLHIRQLYVIKKDGRKTFYDRDKLYKSLKIALRKRPISTETIDIIVNKITQSLEKYGDTEISSDIIGKKISQKLLELDPVAYIRYMSVYHDFKSIKDFEEVFQAMKNYS